MANVLDGTELTFNDITVGEIEYKQYSYAEKDILGVCHLVIKSFNSKDYTLCRRGICNLCLSSSRRILVGLFRKWPSFSGDDKFPIKGGLMMFELSYHSADGCIDYLAERSKLAHFIIKEIENEQEEKSDD